MRSLLFVPAHKTSLLKKAITSKADAIILDLEDSCPEHCHDAGVENILSHAHEFETALVRVRDVGDYWIGETTSGIIVPKAETKQQMVDVYKHALPRKVFALIETAKGVMNAMEIAEACDGLIFGNEDYKADTMCFDFGFARNMIVNAAKANNILAIDTVNVDVHNMSVLAEQCLEAVRLGYDGKLCIHPKEVELIHEYYTPCEVSYNYSKRVVELYNKAAEEGSGVAILDGVYVAPPMVKYAQKIIRKYETYSQND